MKTKAILFGSVPLATWVLKHLLRCDDVTVEGVVCELKSRRFAAFCMDEPCVYDFARDNGIPTLGVSDLAGLINRDAAPYVGVSARFHRILRPEVIDLFAHGIVNLHGGELPRLRGVNCANHALLEGCARGAGTLHFIDQGVDTGDVVDREYFGIDRRDTAHDVFLKTLEALRSVFLRQVGMMGRGPLPGAPQQEFLDHGETTRTYRKADLEAYRCLAFDMAPEEIDRRVRAFTFPGHEPVYFEYEGKKLYVRTGKSC